VIRRTPVPTVELWRAALVGVVGRIRLVARRVACAAWREPNVGAIIASSSSVRAGAFDERYNIRLHPTHGARSRVPRVPALRCIVTPRGAGEPNR
jgi:hypothetical protein